MVWMGKIEGVAGVPVDMYPVIEQGFEKGELYDQIDLGGRDVVRGIAKYFLLGRDETGFFTHRALNQIMDANEKSPGTYVGFAGIDDCGDEIAYVYRRVGWLEQMHHSQRET